MMLISWCLQRCFDRAVEISTCTRSEANEALHKLALSIEDECLWNRVLPGKQKTHEIVVWSRERVLDAEVSRESRHELLVAWSTDV